MKNLPLVKNNHKKAFTLVEVLISLAIIIILTGASIPLYGRLSNKQALDQNSNRFMLDMSLTRKKSASGVITTISSVDTKVWWGIKPCYNGDSAIYAIGYVPLDVDGVPITNQFTLSRTEEFSSDIYFDSATCNSTSYPILFERLNGKLHDSNGASLGEINTVVASDSTTETRTIYVNSAGIMELHE